MTREQASTVYDILVRCAGAREDDRDAFVFHLTDGCKEWRFQGSLGFGGKLYVEPRRWRVGCYREDLTPERAEVIQRTNAVLAGARAVFAALDEALS